ncbi:glycosyltransferase family 2 protein [Zunongwangia sp. F363]|uniref:Glycosyltransferase family 2 protein n=1 Tax=Autumnicola tepida TaxID=3075595 RepID=A0ABU3C8A9_9FLAO|nr:glycosyltransferase family 2 protein [Zunongwangia sp. F363]MDT0642310.1 glycosyltransferase family 2 protein [Zunongwangia sp. F363]
MQYQVAVLLTCHNRKNKTLSCLKALSNCKLPKGISLSVFLVDDGSKDGTGQAVREKFPEVNIIQGDGSLFWNKGMRLAWKKASESKNYDYYFWLNDDTILDRNGFLKIFKIYNEAKTLEKNEVIVTAACRVSFDKNFFSYGGRTDFGPIIPNGELQVCKYINGNAVLIPKKIYKKVGFLSDEYTHGMGDFDYGLRAMKLGYKSYTTKTFVASCPPNLGIPGWCDPKNRLLKRWELFHTPLGLNIKEYIQFRKKFWGNKWLVFAVKAYAKMLFPNLYKVIS